MFSWKVVMYVEIFSCVCCVSGWFLVCSTLPTDYWTFGEMSSVALTTLVFYSNLWKDCVMDFTGVSDCKNYPSMLGLTGFLHGCRALAVSAVCIGFFATALTLIGMKCTKIGGSKVAKARVAFAGGVSYIISGFCGMITYSWWANKLITDFFDPNVVEVKFELGAGVFIGWGGSILLIGGGTALTYFSAVESFCSLSRRRPRRSEAYITVRVS